MPGERTVYQTTFQARRADGHLVRITGHDRRRHVYLNAAFPTDADGALLSTPADLVCPRCGYGYSVMAHRLGGICDECHIEELHALALELQECGIELGWRPRPSLAVMMSRTRAGVVRIGRWW